MTRGAALRLRQHAGAAAAEHRRRRVSQVLVYGTPARCGSRRIRPSSPRAGSRWTISPTAIQNGTSYQGAGQFDGADRTFLLQPQGQLDNAEAVQQPDHRHRDNGAGLSADVAEADDTRAGRAHRPALLACAIARCRRRPWCRGLPAGGRQRRRGRQGRRRSVPDDSANSLPASVHDQADLRPLAERSCTASPTCRRRCSSRSSWSCW